MSAISYISGGIPSLRVYNPQDPARHGVPGLYGTPVVKLARIDSKLKN